jgi:non-ribosomal peptide synthetase component F
MYALCRIKRDLPPEAWDAVVNKRQSAHRIMVAFGLRANRQVYLPKDPAAAADRIAGMFDQSFCAALAAELANRSKGEP